MYSMGSNGAVLLSLNLKLFCLIYTPRMLFDKLVFTSTSMKGTFGLSLGAVIRRRKYAGGRRGWAKLAKETKILCLSMASLETKLPIL